MVNDQDLNLSFDSKNKYRLWLEEEWKKYSKKEKLKIILEKENEITIKTTKED